LDLNTINGDPEAFSDCSIGITCDPESPLAVRLVNGSSPQDGLLEIRVNGTWGTACNKALPEESAKVICRMLGFPSGHASRWKHDTNGTITHAIKAYCSGNEATLTQCPNLQVASGDDCYLKYMYYQFRGAPGPVGITCA